MSKRTARSKPGRTFNVNPRWIAIIIGLAIIVGVWSVWAEDNGPVKDQPGKRIYITADQAMEWVKNKPVAFLQLSWPGCPACQAAGPAIEKLVAEYNLHLAYVDISKRENEWLADYMNVQSTPTIWAFHNGEPVGPPIIGNVGEERFREFFLRHLQMVSS